MRRSTRSASGVATIELMMLVPLLFVVILGVTQVALVALAKSQVSDAALAAARADSLGRNPQAAAGNVMDNLADSTSATRIGPERWSVTSQVRTVFPFVNVDVSDSAKIPGAS